MLWLCVLPARPVGAEDWKVQDRSRRHRLVLRRFQALVEKDPRRGYAFKRLVQLARRSPGLDRLVALYRRKARKAPKRVALRLVLAHLLVVTKQRKQARKAYAEVLRLSPKNLSALYALASLDRELGKIELAFAGFRKVHKLAKGSAMRRRCLKLLGALSLLRKKPKEALAYWKKFLALSPKNLFAREEIARVLVRYKLYVQALEQWREILRRTRRVSRRAGVLRKLGGVLELTGRWQEAVDVYRKAMALTKRGHWLRKELHGRIFQLHREHGKLPRLAVYLRKKKRKESVEWAMLARLLDEIGRDKEAMAVYEKALRLQPSDARLRLKFITLLEVSNETARAIAQYKALIRREPRESRYRLSFAEMLSRVGKRKESLAQMRLLARLFSRSEEVLMRLANFYKRRRMTRDALALYRRLVRVAPSEASHHRALGDYYHTLGRSKEAEAAWRGVLRSGLAKHRAYATLGQIYLEHNQLKKALAATAQALRRKPNELSILTQQGEILQRLLEAKELPRKQHEAAVRVWMRILRLSKSRRKRKHAIHQLFALYHAQGILYRMPRYYRAKIYQNPRTPKQRAQTVKAYRFLGEYYLWRAQRRGSRTFLQARNAFNAILGLAPRDRGALLTLEQLAARRQNWERARELLTRLLPLRKKSKRRVYRRLYNYSLKLGQVDKALAFCRKIVQLHPDDASAHAELARLYRKAGKLTEAIASYEEATRLRPHTYGYKMALASLLASHGKRARAIALYRKALKHARDSRTIYDAALQLMELLALKPKARKRLENDLQMLADMHPKELAYFRALAELYRRQGKMKAYRVAYLKAAATVDQKSQVYRKLAQAAREQGDLQKAIVYTRKMLDETPSPSSGEQMRLARLYFQVGDPKNARKLLLEVLVQHPDSLRVLLRVASLFYSYGMEEEAVRAYELFLELEPQGGNVRLRLAQLYQRRGQMQAAIGVLEALLWQDVGAPRRKPKRSVRKKRRAKQRRLPYYLRRTRRAKRRRLSWTRRQALQRLLALYKKEGLFGQWERRLRLMLEDKGQKGRDALVSWVVSFYGKRRWYGRLERLLQHVHTREPDNRSWLKMLAQVYRAQGKHRKALRLYTRLARQNPSARFRVLVSKIRVLLEMGERRRLGFLVQELLHNLSSDSHSYWQVVGLLERKGALVLVEKMLRWGYQYWSRSGESRFFFKLVRLYRQLGQRSKARTLLWKEWVQPRIWSTFPSVLYYIRRHRGKLLEQLWPLLDGQEQERLRKRSELILLRSLLEHDKKEMKRSLIDAYLVVGMARGEDAASQYLPALWGMTGEEAHDQRFRRRSMKRLFAQGRYKMAQQLIAQVLIKQRRAGLQMTYLEVVLAALPSRWGAIPPRHFRGFLERRLLRLRRKVQRDEWMELVRSLADRYALWGDDRRVIWWIERCRWIGGKQVHEDRRLRWRLAMAYKRWGKKALARRHFQVLLDEAWKRFVRWAQRAPRKRSRRLFSRALTPSQRRWRALLAQWRRRHPMRLHLLRSHRYALLSVYKKYVDADAELALFARLKSKWHSVRDGLWRTRYLRYLAAAYQTSWLRTRRHAARKRLLEFLRGLEQGNRLSKVPDLMGLLASLEAEVGRTQRALVLVRRLLRVAPKKQKPGLLRQLALLYRSTGQLEQEMRVRLMLAGRHKDRRADLWLAQTLGARGRLGEAVRYFQRYQRRRNARRSGGNKRLAQVKDLLELGEFLAELPAKKRSVSTIRHGLRLLRYAALRHGDAYSFARLRKRALRLALKVGLLAPLVKEWEVRRRKHVGDVHTLTMLRVAYSLLERPKAQGEILVELLKRKPKEEALLEALLEIYRQTSQDRRALRFLRQYYAKRAHKPEDYYLRLGEVLLRLGRTKQALGAWHKQQKECLQREGRAKRFRCGFQLGNILLSAGFTKRAVVVFEAFLKRSGARLFWTISGTLWNFVKQKRYAQLLQLTRKVLPVRVEAQLGPGQMRYFRFLLKAYSGLGQHKKREALLARLRWRTFQSRWTIAVAARLFEEQGELLLAEHYTWQLFLRREGGARRKAYRQLCRLWDSGGLGRLCDGQEIMTGRQVPVAARLALARAFLQRGFFFSALLELRKLWLVRFRDVRVLTLLAKVSRRLGRDAEAKQFASLARRFVRKARKQDPKRRANRKPRLLVGGGGRLTRRLWKRALPADCKAWKRVGGKLRPVDCARGLAARRQALRCARHVVRAGSLLLSNDCHGRILAVSTRSGEVRWVYQPASSPAQIQLKVSAAFRSRHGKRRPRLRRFLWVAGLKVVGADAFVALQENGMERIGNWGWGAHRALTLLKLDTRSGKVSWKRRFVGEFLWGPLHVQDGRISFVGRVFRVLSARDGKELWRFWGAGEQGPWLFGKKEARAHLASKDGFVVAGHERWLFGLGRDGKERWRRRLPWQSYALARVGGLIYAVLGNDKLAVLRWKDGKQQALWEWPGGRTMRFVHWSPGFFHNYWVRSPLLVRAKRLFFAGADGFFYAYARRSGRLLWKKKLGDHGMQPATLDEQGRRLAFLGDEGTLSMLASRDGALHWRVLFAPQTRKYSARSFRVGGASRPILSASRVWVGVYDRFNRFWLVALRRRMGKVRKRVGALLGFLRKAKRRHGERAVALALSRSIPKNDSVFRPQFLRLAGWRVLSLRRRLRWAYAYLATGASLAQDLKRIVPLFGREVRFDQRGYAYWEPFSPESEFYVMRWVLGSWRHRARAFSPTLQMWRKLAMARWGDLRLTALRCALTRRMGALLLSSKGLGELAAYTQVLWGDQQGRAALLAHLAGKWKGQSPQAQALRRRALALLARWGRFDEWEGVLEPRDVPALKKLLSRSGLRADATVAMAHFAVSFQALHHYNTPRLRERLFQLGKYGTSEVSLRSALLLGRLGDWRGVQLLRARSHGIKKGTQRRLAGVLLRQFEDLWGKKNLLAHYQGENRYKLTLPAFRIFYASWLVDVHETAQARAQIKRMLRENKALLTSSHHKMAWVLLGRCAFKEGKMSLALRWFRKARAVDRYNLDIIALLGRTLYAQGRLTQARKHLERFVRHNGLDEKAYRLLALLYLRDGKAEKAAALFRNAFTLDPGWNEGYAAYAWTLTHAPKPDLKEAHAWLQKAIQRRPLPRYFVLQARLFRLGKQHKAARKALQTAIQREAPSPQRTQWLRLQKQWFPHTTHALR